MNLPTELPIFPLGNVLFPGAQMPLHIFEERYRLLMRERRDADPIFGVVLTKSGLEVGDEPSTHVVGTAATLLAGEELVDGRWAILVQGTRRFRLIASSWERSYLIASVEWIEPEPPIPASELVAARMIRDFVAYLRAVGDELADPASISSIDEALRSTFADDLDGLTYLIAAQLPLNTWSRQRLLEITTLEHRSRAVMDFIRQERALLRRAGATTDLTGNPSGQILPN